MNCQNGTPVFTIFLGDQKIINMRLAYPETGLPFDLTSATNINILLPNADGSTSIISGGSVTIVSPPTSGQFYATILSAVSALLRVGEFQDILAQVTISGNQQTYRFPSCLSVYQS